MLALSLSRPTGAGPGACDPEAASRWPPDALASRPAAAAKLEGRPFTAAIYDAEDLLGRACRVPLAVASCA
jgi:hypothetical protein